MKEFIAKFHHPTGTKDGTAEYRTHVFKAFDAERAKAYCLLQRLIRFLIVN